MTSRDFCYWLQGFFEINSKGAKSLDAEQTEMVKAHLAMVFKHEIDPSMGNPAHQEELDKIHESIGKLKDEVSKMPHGHHPDHVVYRC